MEELESVGESSEVCSKIVLKCMYLATSGRLDILWSVNKLATLVKKSTRACDRRFARLISYIHHTNDYRQYCHVGSMAQHCRLGLFQDSDFVGDFEGSESTSGPYFYSVPERRKLRHLRANQNNRSSLQETHYWCSSSGRNVWWLGNSRSQSPQWERLISKQSPMRSRGTRSSYSMNSILSVQSENFSGDGKESRKAESHLYWQFLGFWQSLLENRA